MTINLGFARIRGGRQRSPSIRFSKSSSKRGETITLIAGGGYVYEESDDPVGVTYGGLALEWNPDGDFEAEFRPDQQPPGR
ncbi:hypothetical protein [Devosia ginsengisoli]|uniref:hypothetical protein n=1 Tax=Devosia ginsengisoli TaxID=400770 RepID=UPI0026F04567|nr:hypothetical protein [Devosia ginsengisoli]MCR6669771.1 hypothetical protein [Devosia ginsengisoli]